jgi:hypothetical protein
VPACGSSSVPEPGSGAMFLVAIGGIVLLGLKSQARWN